MIPLVIVETFCMDVLPPKKLLTLLNCPERISYTGLGKYGKSVGGDGVVELAVIVLRRVAPVRDKYDLYQTQLYPAYSVVSMRSE